MDHYSILDPPSQPTQEHQPSLETTEDRSPSDLRSEPGYFPSESDQSGDAEVELAAILNKIVQQSQYATGASGAAIALSQGKEIICRAASGSSAPDLGVRLQVKSGLTGECLRTGEPLRCDNAELDPRVDLESCRRLGIESIVVMPIFYRKVLVGIFELFSRHAYSFQERDVETLRTQVEAISAALADAERNGLQIIPQDAEPQHLVAREESSEELKPQLQLIESVERTTCKNCNAVVEKATVICAHCGAYLGEESADDAEEDTSRWERWRRWLPLKRIVVPAAFVSLAIVVALVPIQRRNPVVSPPTVAAATPVSAAAGDATSSSRSADSSSTAPGSAQPLKTKAVDNAAVTTTAEPDNSGGEGSKNTTLAAAIRQLLAGVSSDFSKLLPINDAEEAPAPPTGDPNATVWVDRRKGFYYCKNDQQYGKTGRGTYMIQKKAQADYYIPALMRPCP